MPVIPSTLYVANSTVPYADQGYQSGDRPTEPINPLAIYVDKDHASASDANDGTASLPFLTIHAAALSIDGVGGHIYVKESTLPYADLNTVSGQDLGGNVIIVSGGADIDNYLIIQGFPGDALPVIDPNYGDAGDDENTGFGIIGDFVHLKDLEISHIQGSGIMFTTDERNYPQDCIFENLHIHDCRGPDGGNTGGIRLDHAIRATVTNCHIHDIERTGGGGAYFSGIHGYKPGDCIIEYCEIYNVDYCVYQKHPPKEADSRENHTIRYNYLHDSSSHAIKMDDREGALPDSGTQKSAKIYGNVIEDVGGGPLRSRVEGTASGRAQGGFFEFYNNTIINSGPLYVEGLAEIQSWNNIFTNGSESYTLADTNSVNGYLTNFNYMDYNLYYSMTIISRLDYLNRRSQSNTYSTFSAWQSAYTLNTFALTAQPDANGDTFDPQLNAAFEPQAAGALTMGRGGIYADEVGAFGVASRVGPDWSVV